MGVGVWWGAWRRRVLAGAGILAIVAVVVWTFNFYRGVHGLSPFENARYFNLADGRAQIAVSQTDNHHVVVSWRNAAGTEWGSPEVVTQSDDEIDTLRIRVAGSTLALVATYVDPNVFVQEEEPDPGVIEDAKSTSFVVCADGDCQATDAYPGHVNEAPQVTPDGEHVLLGVVDGAYLTWHGGDILEERPAGLPDGAYGEGQPLQAPDGSLRTVVGQPAASGCDFSLLTTPPGGTDFSESARFSRSDVLQCHTTLESFAADYVVVSHSKYNVTFLAQRDDTWRRVSEDPSGQVRYPRSGTPELAGAFEVSGFWHWRQVVASSPDGRSLVVQVHFPGDETWGPPREVARAPAGSTCLSIDPMPTYTRGEEDPFYLNLTCRSRPAPGADWIYSYPTIVTEDGVHWEAFTASDSAVRIGKDLFFQGRPSYRWTPESGLRRVGLDAAEGERITLLSNGTYALSSLVRGTDGCTVQVRLAEPGETEWSAPVRSTTTPLPDGLCALEQVQVENRNVYHYFDAPSDRMLMVRLVWRDGAPVLEDGPS